jgi:tRNA G18 (ribose-2'-O)-methylase SpoU
LGMKHSLNVSVAGGVVLWELVRTRIIWTAIWEI